MKKTLFIIIVFALIGIVFGIVYASPKSHTSVVQRIANQNPVRSTPTPQPEAGTPETISIPSINVSQVPVEHVGKDSQGRMAVPTDWYDTGWYELGPKPGEKGNAVIDGHLDTPSGAPSVFWDLKKLQPGDTIQVTDSNGKTLTFSVTQVTSYALDNFPIEEVFGSYPTARLNLITCGGAWDATTHIYNERIVAYSELKE